MSRAQKLIGISEANDLNIKLRKELQDVIKAGRDSQEDAVFFDALADVVKKYKDHPLLKQLAKDLRSAIKSGEPQRDYSIDFVDDLVDIIKKLGGREPYRTKKSME